LALIRDLTERVRGVPSVTGVSATMNGLFSGGWSGMHVEVPGFTPASLSETQVGYDGVGPDFFHTIGTRVLAGRDFDARDTESAARVAIINETAAKAYFQGIDPIGRAIGEHGDHPSTIVGVVADVRDRSVRANPADSTRRVYFPIAQRESSPGFVLAVRVHGDPAAEVGAIRDAVLARDGSLAFEISPVNDLVRDSVAEDRLTTNVVAVFGVVALLLAAIGLYGLTSYATSQRTGEFGLRLALGAEPGSVTRMILREGTALALLGLAAGVPAGLLATRLIRRQMFGVGPLDPPSLALAVLVLAAMAIAASYLPARRASRVAPIDALRME
jgi:predicted permease